VTHFVLSEQAQDDLLGIAENLADLIGQDAGEVIFDRLYAAADLLAEFPEMGRWRPDLDPGIRSFPIEEYLILYRIEESVIVVVRITRQAQDVFRLFGSR